MGYHVVHLLRLAIKLDVITTFFVAAGAELFIFVWTLCGLLLGVLLKYSTLLRRVPGDIYQACFIIGWPIARMACMIFLALSSAALIGVGWRGGFYHLTFPENNGTFGLCPGGDFRRRSSFVDVLRNFHAFKFCACLLVGIPLKVPAL